MILLGVDLLVKNNYQALMENKMIGINDKNLDFIRLILNSDLSRPTKEEIVRFWCLPRNTSIRSAIEEPSHEDIGAIERPDAETKEYNSPKNKIKREEDEAVEELLDEEQCGNITENSNKVVPYQVQNRVGDRQGIKFYGIINYG